MLTLFLDTVDAPNIVLLFKGKVLLAKKEWMPRQNEAEKLLPAIQDLLKKNKLDFKDLQLIVAVTGPGRFTSTRVGILVANTLSYLLDIPIVGINRLELLAWRLHLIVGNADLRSLHRTIFPLQVYLQSEKGDFFHAAYKKIGDVENIRLVTELPSVWLKKEKGTHLVIEKGQPNKTKLAPVSKAVPAFLASKKSFWKTPLLPVYVRAVNITRRKKL